MSNTKKGEKKLTKAFENGINIANISNIQYKYVDFHGVTQGTNFSAINIHALEYEDFIRECGVNVLRDDVEYNQSSFKNVILRFNLLFRPAF